MNKKIKPVRNYRLATRLAKKVNNVWMVQMIVYLGTYQ